MRSVMTHSFSQIPEANMPRSVFNRSHGYKTTFDAGYLVPVFVDEALPGDSFNLKMTAFARLATPIAPIMDNMFMDSFFFAVPLRLLWTNFKKFMGEQAKPTDSTSYLLPRMQSTAVTGYATGSLHDYFGLPTDVAGYYHSSMFHRAYNLIYNEWFRDQNIQDSVVVDLDDGPDDPADYVLLRRGKRHDYFTSALPWPQKGTAVQVPLGSQAIVRTSTTADLVNAAAPEMRIMYSNDTLPGGDILCNINSTGQIYGAGGGSAFSANRGIVPTNLFADLTTATASTINQLRQAFQIQRLYERDARGGTRYTEIVRSHFNVVSPDARLQRPEYLGGGSSAVNIHPVTQTSSTDATTPQGNMSAFGTASCNGQGFVKSFTEHCVLIGLVSVRADLNYQQGLNRMFSRRSRWDFYWPSLAHLGEQEVLSKEIFCDATGADENVFGYQERYAEYRYKPSVITGKFRSSAAGDLDVWHLAQDFAIRPTLSPAFIVEDPPIARVIAVPSEPHFIFDSYFDFKCARPMPTYSVPGLIDHL